MHRVKGIKIAAAVLVLMGLAILCGPAVRAQAFDLEGARVAVVSLDGQWRFHVGDSPQQNGKLLWASPELDDTAWPVVQAGRSWASQGYRNLSGWAWYRFQVKIPAGERPTALLLAPIITGYELYVDGEFVARCGTISPDRAPNPRMSFHLYPLTATGSPASRTITVAIRVWHSPLWASYLGGGSFVTGNLAGDPALLAVELQHQETSRNSRFVDWYCYSIAAGLVGLVVLCLFLIRPADREYLAFATMLLAQAADCVANLLHEIWAMPPVPVFDMLDGLLNATAFIANFYFISRILNVGTGRLGRIFVAMAACSGFCAALYWPGWTSVPQAAALQLLLVLPVVVWSILLLLREAVRGDQDARLLLVPMLLAAGYYALDNLVMLLSQAGFMHRPAFMDRRLPLPPFSIRVQILLDLIFLLAMLVFLIRRFSRARQREERLAGEFEAARQVQQVLIPDDLTQSPGFRVSSVYMPAEQVGGDFFQQIEDENGGLLIVTGDVSGKGLPAAMVVSVLVGAIRAEAAHGAEPAALLDALNACAMGHTHGGFVTCLAAHIRADGLMTVANAGHLAPYLNGDELAVMNSLPLAIVPNVRYESTTVLLRPGDVLTFVSDGVVEAQRPNGELLGFERTRELIEEPADRIAQAAVEFGQLDDITVLKVEYCGAPCAEPMAGTAAAT